MCSSDLGLLGVDPGDGGARVRQIDLRGDVVEVLDGGDLVPGLEYP